MVLYLRPKRLILIKKTQASLRPLEISRDPPRVWSVPVRDGRNCLNPGSDSYRNGVSFSAIAENPECGWLIFKSLDLLLLFHQGKRRACLPQAERLGASPSLLHPLLLQLLPGLSSLKGMPAAGRKAQRQPFALAPAIAAASTGPSLTKGLACRRQLEHY